MPFVMSYSTTEEELVYVHRIIVDSVILNMIAMVHQNTYGAIKIYLPVSEGFYLVQYTPMTYILPDSIEVNSNITTEGTLVCDAKYISPAQENSR